ncbi:ergothioneine biosynthesis protein EgtB [Flavobacterium sp.]
MSAIKNTNEVAKNVEREVILADYIRIRKHSEHICTKLKTEDYVVQPAEFVSPPKWHLGHTTWFFETMVLVAFYPDYTVFNINYNFIFNSYYESIGARVIRTNRGNLSRPIVEEVYEYRNYVNSEMQKFLSGTVSLEALEIIILGLNHEQQHQELLYTDIKFILGNNPLLPTYDDIGIENCAPIIESEWINFKEGIYEIGHQGPNFCFDNELQRHKTFLNSFSICSQLVTNAEYLLFMQDGGYDDYKNWLAEGWDWKKVNQANAPLYWYKIDGQWYQYTLAGLQPVFDNQPVTHLNFFEAQAFATWKGLRLPLESEWEIASEKFKWGSRWEWTQSAYLPYSGFVIAPDPTGEYNGKFMINQMVLRGASVATPLGHSRSTYRNFFHPQMQWQFTGIRLAK